MHAGARPRTSSWIGKALGVAESPAATAGGQAAGEDATPLTVGTAPSVVYRSEITIVRDEGPIRRGFLSADEEPVYFGVHDEVAEHYGVSADRFPRSTRRWTTSWPQPGVD